MRRLRALALVLLSALAADQLVQWTLLRGTSVLGRPLVPYDPPLFTPEQLAGRERIRAALQGGQPLTGFAFDPELGWCVPADGGRGELRFDWAGARIAREPLARAKTPGRRRIVVLGDSFTLGDEVGAQESWPARLEEARPELEIVNLGMNAYGLDQSLLRLEKHGFALEPDEVWIGFVPGTLLRIVTHYVPAWRHVSPMLACKPRFVLAADGELGACARPCDSLAGLLALLDDGRRLAEACSADRWIARAPAAWAPRGASWTHYFASTRLALSLYEQSGRDPEAEYQEPGEALALARAIVRRASDECRARGVPFRLLLLPDRDDLAARTSWRPCLGDLATFDAGAALLAAGAQSDGRYWAPRGHYSAAGNRLVAAALAAETR